MRVDTVVKTELKEVLVPIPQIRIDTVPAIVKVYYPVVKDSIQFVKDSSLIAQRDSLTLLLKKETIKIIVSCDTVRNAIGDSIPWVHFHTEYDELNRFFFNTIVDVRPVRARIPEQTQIITKEPRFTFGVGGGIGLNSNLNATNIQFGWNVGVQLTYNLWSF